MGRRVLLPSVVKVIAVLIEKIKGQSTFTARENYTTDSLRDLFPTVTCANISWTSPGVALLVSIARLGKLSQSFCIFGVRINCTHDILIQAEILVINSVLMIIKYKYG